MVSSLAALIALAPTLTVHVDGDGYLRFVRDGRTVYAKESSLTIVDGKLASVDGPLVNPRIQVPADVTELSVDLSGRIFGGGRELGRFVLALFPDDVRLVVDSGFLVSSYRPALSDAGAASAGVVRTGKKGEISVTVTAPATVGGVEIILRDSVTVDGPTFSLGEIATVTADEATKARIEALDVSNTPALGVPYRMTAETVRVRLLRYGKEAEKYRFSGASLVTVTRRGQDVTPAMFEEAATKAARERLGEDTPVLADAGSAIVIAPVGKLELVAEDVQPNGTRLSVRVAIIVDGERFNSRTVMVEKHDPASKLRIGQQVKLLVRSGAATVETSGRVRSVDLATGTVVVTSATGAELVGKAVAVDTVEVKL